MAGLKFGAFLAPHHPIGEHPMLQFQADLELVELLDKLGYEEFWCGEHHSTGWEVIASPEMFLAAAGQRSHRIRLGTGVVSLPYHHPFIVAQRMVQLDHMTGGRAIFGSGPGALPSDAFLMGIDPMTQRDRQDEAIGVIQKLLRGEERVTHESDWFTVRDAKLQLRPLQEEMPFAVASMISPSGMTLAGKYGTGVLSIGSMSTAGLQNLSTQWSFAEESAEKHGNVVDRKNWRIVLMWHIAETREKAIEESRDGLLRWHNEYNVGTLMRPGVEAFKDRDEAVELTAFADGATAVIGTPDDLVQRLRDLIELTGGFGVAIGFVHDWASRANTRKSWDLVARYVVPELNGMLDAYRESRNYVVEHRESFERAGQAILAKIHQNPRAAEALKQSSGPNTPLGSHHEPDLKKAAKEGSGDD
ncbi:MAG: LLM class flavin-dependent oxidoreductase [Minwuia sp.]|uniref:LLM class flavin-dependent oxidoreductase n=1 Tax=Minwuia sp. TaxID=2493630 RepID=UPI003A8A4DD6